LLFFSKQQGLRFSCRSQPRSDVASINIQLPANITLRHFLFGSYALAHLLVLKKAVEFVDGALL